MKHKSMLHGSDMMGQTARDSGSPRKGTYKNDVDHPPHQQVHKGHVSATKDLGMMKCCADFKAEAADQAWGQSGKDGLMSDEKKIHSQFFHAYSDDTGY